MVKLNHVRNVPFHKPIFKGDANTWIQILKKWKDADKPKKAAVFEIDEIQEYLGTQIFIRSQF